MPPATRVAYVLAPAAVFVAPFVNFLTYQGYDLTRAEVFHAGGIVMAAGLLLGAVLALRPPTLGQILLAACILLSLDMGFQSFRIEALAPTGDTPWSVKIWHWAAVIGLLVGARLLYRHFSVIVLIVFAVLTGATVLIPGSGQTKGVVLQRPVEAGTSAGPIIHLILDEFIGIEGIPADIEGGSALQEDLKRFFLENEFRLHGGAYSTSSMTQHAVAALLNGEFFPSAQNAFERVDGDSSWHLRRNAWFERMAAKGYAIRVYDNSWLGYCAEDNPRIESCDLFPANSVVYLQSLDIPDLDKAKVLLSAFMEVSPMTESLRDIVKVPLYRLGALATSEVLERIAEAVASGGPGRLIFAHLLSPHYSYVYGAECGLKADIDTWSNRALPFRRQDEAINTTGSRIERYQAYFAQVRCMKRQLQGLFDSLRAAGRYDEATIIIHGDHGSRISIWNPEVAVGERLSDRDIIDNYATLYAIKRPGLAPAYDPTARSIQALFAETFLKQPIHPDRGEIVLRLTYGELINSGRLLRPFPDFQP